VRHHRRDRRDHVRLVVDEVGDAEVGAVDRLLRSLQAEPDVALGNSGQREEAVVPQPFQRPLLHPRPALGHQPRPPVEQPHQPRDRIESTAYGGGPQHRRGVAGEERRVTGSRGSVDDHPADVDSQSVHVTRLIDRALQQN
jgi:hypothetical protein